jgi:excisionase family DNA binding protein
MQKLERPTRLTFTVSETAEILGVSRSTLYLMLKRGEISSLRFGSRQVITRAYLEELLGEKIELNR